MTPLVEQRRHRSSNHHDELLTQGDIVSKVILFGAAILSLVLLAVTAAYPQTAANQNPPTYTEAQIDQMLVPIARYPDDPLAQVLMASTYAPHTAHIAAAMQRFNPDRRWTIAKTDD